MTVFGLLAVVAATAQPVVEDTGWDPGAFLVQLSLAAGYNISCAVYVSDYSRYLPADAAHGKSAAA